MKVGVIGGTRFIGVHLVRALLRRGDEPILLNRGLSREPEAFSRPVERIRGDRRDPRALDRLLARPLDAVIDLCGYKPADVAPVLERGGRFGTYAFVSTSSVYRVPAPVPYDESTLRRSEANTYGGDKAAAENLVLQASRPGRPAVVLRPQAVTGPWGAEQALHALKRAAAKAPVLLRPGTEKRRLCPLWVGDLVEALLKAVEEPRAAGRAFDLAGPDAVDAAGFVAAAARACGGRGETVPMTSAQAETCPWLGLPWLDHDLVASGSLAREFLTPNPTPLAVSLERTWAWASAEPALSDHIPDRGEADAACVRETPAWRRFGWSLSDAALASARAARRAMRPR